MTELPIDVIYSGDDAAGGLGGLADLAGGTLAVAFGSLLKDAIEGALGALSNFVNQAAQAEVQQAGLVALLNSTAGAAGLTQDAVNRLANQFRDLAGGSDEAVVAIEEIGIRSGQVSASQMPAFIKAVLDLGSVMGSTTSAATLLARAQDDPAGAFARLERLTGVYDLALKENIKTMVKHGDTAGAVAAIMEYVARTTGGAAAAAADTASGKWAILTNHFEDFFKALAEHVLPVIERLLDVAIPVLDSVYQSFENTFIPLIDQASAWGEGIINALASGMASAAQAVVDVISQLGAIIASWMQPGSPPKFLPNLDKWGEEAVNVYMGGWQNFDKSVFDELYKAIKGGLPTQEIQEYADATKALTQAQSALNDITEHYDTLLNPLNAKLKGIQNQQKKLQDADELTRLRMIINSNTGYSASAKQQAALQIQEILTREQISAIQDEKDTAVGAAKDKVSAAQTVADQLKASIDLQLQFTQATGPSGAAGAAHALAGGLAHIAQAAGAAAGGLGDLGGKLKDDNVGITNMWMAMDNAQNKAKEFVDKIKGFFADLGTNVASYFGPSGAGKDIGEAIQGWVDDFKQRVPAMETAWKNTVDLVKSDWDIVWKKIKDDAPGIVTDLGVILKGLEPLWKAVLDSLSANWTSWTTGFTTIIAVGFVVLEGAFKLGLDAITAAFTTGQDLVSGNWDKWKEDWKTAVGKLFDDLKAIVDTGMTLVYNAYKTQFDSIGGAVSDTMDTIKNVVGGALRDLQGLWDFITGHNFNVNVSIPGLPPGRAIGGPVDSGMPYMVGERGPELFVPRQSGTILPNGTGAGLTINIDARGSNDPDSIRQAGYEGAQRALQEAGYRADQYTRMGTVGA